MCVVSKYVPLYSHGLILRGTTPLDWHLQFFVTPYRHHKGVQFKSVIKSCNCPTMATLFPLRRIWSSLVIVPPSGVLWYSVKVIVACSLHQLHFFLLFWPIWPQILYIISRWEGKSISFAFAVECVRSVEGYMRLINLKRKLKTQYTNKDSTFQLKIIMTILYSHKGWILAYHDTFSDPMDQSQTLDPPPDPPFH